MNSLNSANLSYETQPGSIINTSSLAYIPTFIRQIRQSLLNKREDIGLNYYNKLNKKLPSTQIVEYVSSIGNLKLGRQKVQE